ncbi:SpoIIE family protein phosphatase [Frankia sp. Cj3]|uniref:SpoIIE family protein phosphatase n=1 Tax=Frankia sp. Cj3 TaxID=2880976 RepID=UPI001EF4E788|nr:SpoIIE family protein phosphatase [Frankia sp. Cj3]
MTMEACDPIIDDLLGVVNTATAAVDPHGIITAWSAPAYQLLGYSPDEIVGKLGIGLLATGVPGPARRAVADQRGWSGKVAVRHRDGRQLDIVLCAYPLRDAAGRIQWFLVAPVAAGYADPPDDSFGHVGDRTIVEWGFRQAELFIVIYDSQTRFWRLSAGAKSMLGLDETDLRGRPFMEALRNPSYEGFAEQLRQVVETGRSVVYENYVRVPSEPRDHAWATSMSPIKAPDGRVLGVFAAAFDVSEQYWARQRLALLDDASSRIGSTLDVTRTAQELADMAIPTLADWASVDLLDSVYHGGEPAPGPLAGQVTLRRVAHHCVVDGELDAVVSLGELCVYPDFSLPARCLATGQPMLSGTADPDAARRAAADPVRATASQHAFHSVMAVPLRARGATLGVALFGRHRHAESFRRDDLVLAEELGSRAAISIDNARRYTRERTTALALQRSLLPQRLPEQTAVEVASRYLPASSQVGVGGDWYDVIAMSGTRVALVVGDVVGHGVHAAATMGRLRTAVRTLIDIDLYPGELLTRLDDVVARLAADHDGVAGNTAPLEQEAVNDIGATCLCAVYDPVSRVCTLARAGHLQPVLVTPDGTAAFLDVPAGPPLGLGGLLFEAAEVELPAGSLLALYTDGLVESRDRDIDVGLEALCAALAPLRSGNGPPGQPVLSSSLEAICDRVLDALLPEHPADDVALLLARTRALDASQVASWDLPADPAVVAHVRAGVLRTLGVWGLAEAASTTELLVSELVTNAIRHGRAPIQVRLIRDTALICEVSDASRAAPHLCHARTFDESGRGLFLVAQLAARWGTRQTRDGKIIWAEQALAAAPRGEVREGT